MAKKTYNSLNRDYSIVISIIYNNCYQPIYAKDQTSAPSNFLNRYVVKVIIDKHSIKRGHTQTIDAIVKSRSGTPTTGTTVSFTIDYADLKTTRQVAIPLDSSGHASYSWEIGDHVKTGEFIVAATVQGPGFESKKVAGQSFFVVQKARNSAVTSVVTMPTI